MRRTVLCPTFYALWLFVPAVFGAGPSPPRSELQAVTQALADRKYDDALRLVEAIIKREPGDYRAWTAKGLAEAGLGKSGQALTSFDQALSLRADFLPAMEGAAQIEYQSRDPKAESRLERIVALQPENPTAHAMLGVLAYEKKACTAAVTHFEASRGIIDHNPQALWEFGQCSVSINRAEQAAVAFRKLVELQPGNRQARYNLGLAQVMGGRYKDAIEALEGSVKAARPDPDALNLIAAAYEADHQTDAAVVALRKATEIAPKDEKNYLDLGSLCMDHGSFELGIEIINVGLRNIPGSARLYAMRGILHAQTAQYQEAEMDFEQANRLDPTQNFATVGLGITFLQQDSPEESVHVLRERLASAPRDPALNYLYAEVLVRKGVVPRQPEFEEARAALLRSIQAKPDFAQAHARLGQLCLLSGDTQSALQESELAVKLAPRDRMCLYQFVQALRQAGRNHEIPPLLARLRTLEAQEMKAEGDRNRIRLVKGPPAPLPRP
jgi:tetratricopeptide (TPR) repeat protein